MVLKGRKFKFKAPRTVKVVQFEVGAVRAGKENAKEMQELLSRLWALSGLGGAAGSREVSGRERGEYSLSWGWGSGRWRSDCKGKRARVLSDRQSGG